MVVGALKFTVVLIGTVIFAPFDYEESDTGLNPLI